MALTGGHKVCLWVVILGCLAIITGSAAPFLVVLDAFAVKFSFGAWFGCTETALTGQDCDTYAWADNSFDDYSVWFYVFHASAGLATLLGLILVIISLAKVCGDSDSARGAGALGLITGLLGIGAAVVLYLKTESAMAFVLATNDHMGWAFYVFCSGSGVLAVFSIILLALPNANASRVAAY